jgi:hypothetical protein
LFQNRSGKLQRQTRFPTTAHPGQCQQPRIRKASLQIGYITLPTDEARQRGWQVVADFGERCG